MAFLKLFARKKGFGHLAIFGFYENIYYILWNFKICSSYHYLAFLLFEDMAFFETANGQICSF